MLALPLFVGPLIPSCGDVEDTLFQDKPDINTLKKSICLQKCFHSGRKENLVPLPHITSPQIQAEGNEGSWGYIPFQGP